MFSTRNRSQDAITEQNSCCPIFTCCCFLFIFVFLCVAGWRHYARTVRTPCQGGKGGGGVILRHLKTPSAADIDSLLRPPPPEDNDSVPSLTSPYVKMCADMYAAFCALKMYAAKKRKEGSSSEALTSTSGQSSRAGGAAHSLRVRLRLGCLSSQKRYA
jgi:hypothetical protein